MTSLSKHFTLAEFLRSDKAEELGIKNVPNDDQLENLYETAENMELVRALFNAPLIVSSGLRVPVLNRAVGGSSTSDHTKGLACDFTVKGFTNTQVFDTIKASALKFDQLIYEGTWIHIGFGSRMRRQTLSMRKVNGRTKYFPA